MYISGKPCTIPVKLLKAKKVYSALCATTTACSGEKRSEINTEGKHNWKDVCKVMYDSTIEPHLREFQFKILHNYLPLNDKLYKWKISECFRCYYCFISAKSAVHLLCHCSFTKNLYLEINQWLAMCNVNLPNCDDNIILYGISPSTKHNTLLDHIIMLFKLFVYNCRSNIKSLNFITFY